MLGAAVPAVLFELAKNGFAVYAATIGNFERYDAGNEALSGVFGLILALVFWVYVSGLVLVIGAFVTRLQERRMAPRRQSAVRRLWKRMGADRRRARLVAMAADSPAAPKTQGITGDGFADPAQTPSPTPPPEATQVGPEASSDPRTGG
jgi:membrane protein